MQVGIVYASVAGCLAAGAGLLAKFALSREMAREVIQKFDDYLPNSSWNTEILQAVLGVAALVVNSVMLTMTAKAFHYCSSTIQSVVFTSAVNFSVTALLGIVLLGERIGFLGVLGMILIQIGLFLMSRDKEKQS